MSSNARARSSGSSGSSVQVRQLGPQPLPGRVERPHRRGRPADAGLLKHDPQRGELLEDSLAHDADRPAGHDVAVPDVLLEVVRGPARATVLLDAAGVDRHRQAGLHGRGVDRPVTAVAERRLRARGKQHLDEARVARAALYLLHGEVRVLERHADGAQQPRLGGEPLLRDPVVQRLAEHRGQLGCLRPPDLALERVEDAVLDVVLVEQLPPQQLEVAAREASLGPRVDPVAGVAHPRVDRGRRCHTHAEVLVAAPPAVAEARLERRTEHHRVDVGVDQRHARAGRRDRCLLGLGARHGGPRTPPRSRPGRSRPRRARASGRPSASAPPPAPGRRPARPTRRRP
jgi:hypothetical protein